MGLEEFDVKKIGIIAGVAIVLIIAVWFFVLAPKPADTVTATQQGAGDTQGFTGGPPDYNDAFKQTSSGQGNLIDSNAMETPEDKPVVPESEYESEENQLDKEFDSEEERKNLCPGITNYTCSSSDEEFDFEQCKCVVP